MKNCVEDSMIKRATMQANQFFRCLFSVYGLWEHGKSCNFAYRVCPSNYWGAGWKAIHRWVMPDMTIEQSLHVSFVKSTIFWTNCPKHLHILEYQAHHGTLPLSGGALDCANLPARDIRVLHHSVSINVVRFFRVEYAIYTFGALFFRRKLQ